MDHTKVQQDSAISKINTEEVQKHTNSVSIENVEKLTIRTKNGYVNGVGGEEKCKSSKKNIKNDTTQNATKESKKNKKGQDSIHHKAENSNPNSTQRKNKNSHKNKSDSSSCVIKNCITINDINEKSTIHSTTMKTNCSTKKNLDTEESSLKLNQSDTKLNDPLTGKPETKHKKSKSKLNKTEPNIQQEQNKFNLPKLDATHVINASENLPSDLSEPSCSTQLEITKSHVLDCADGSSEFEKDLIESIKNMKLQQNNVNNESSTEKISGDHSTEKEAQEESPDVIKEELPNVAYVQYESELQMPMIMKIIQKDLSEPYSIYTYRYFIHNWPKLCFLAMCEEKCVGAIVCKLDFHRKSTKRGYIAMLAVDKDYRKRKIGSTLVRRAIKEMISGGADEVVLETEVTNKSALRLYEQLGFVRDKRLFRYYLNGVDALRLKLWLR